MATDNSSRRVPLLLLKTKSAPADGYEEFFNTFEHGRYRPAFVPVLEHRFKQDALEHVRHCITGGGFVPGPESTLARYGAMIFTSQRAVEAFSEIIESIKQEGQHNLDELLPVGTPLYVVGPATARGLKCLGLHCAVLGEDSGNGQVLAHFILAHYNGLYKGAEKPPILFLVGEKRRDIIPVTLQSNDLAPEKNTRVDELVIYETGEMQSFKSDFSLLWHKNNESRPELQWVVVFSPTGCRAMLESLNLIDELTRKSIPICGPRNTYVATIGPTTRDYLLEEFNFCPDVCAEKPSPEGIASGILSFTNQISSRNDDNAVSGTKRRASSAVSPKSQHRAKIPKKQTKIEDTMAIEKEDTPTDIGMAEPTVGGEGGKESIVEVSSGDKESDEKQAETGDTDRGNGNGKIQESSQREKKIASTILEKGIIYFLTRNRVGIDDAESVNDLQRTFFVLRPLPVGTKLGDGALPDLENSRLLALPKKTFPKSHSDRFMAFVEKGNTSIKDLKESFLQGSEYETKPQGSRHVDHPTPVGEGVYVLTRTEDRTTHLAYSLTIPSKLGEMQEDLGIKEQGSFIISIKNPERAGPASTRLPQKPDFPKEVIKEFRGLAWSEVKPHYLDYANAQILLIGENTETSVEQTKKDKKHGKETAKDELERLEHEDELRVEHLKGDDSVFDDLQISKKDFSDVPTTW
ncbi:tetrapyrrole biosynthesis, uroporphyrinogen III synthase [Amniculicola lignicola CBS 123094]|uniref:Tetrapyrrole biosynthesis, uroporphyrinogen III synthase n=1 Tax=Amniculicola lignicola CBS 123094 TaxID=1392246 RepID=A0A6A5WVT6_9PLEO|nr:tetrapyrrole biosynthesis, uroporphyrinogen III synthase [Amniculicola lignicola CBS 123094]